MARRQRFQRFGKQGRLPGATSRDRRNAAAQSIPLTAGSGLKGDRLGRHSLQIDPNSFLYVGPDGLSARTGDGLAVQAGSPNRLVLSPDLMGSVAALRTENARLVKQNAALLARLEAQEQVAVAINAEVVDLDARIAALEVL